jgi:2'-5' RNA ligase superfamily
VSRSAVIVEVPEARPVVEEWRQRHTHDAPLGVPPHVTLLSPFVPVVRLGEALERRLAALLADMPAFDAVFTRTARFPEVLYLEPEPAEPFSHLTAAIAAEWPEHPPYEGVHETVIPHLTVAESEDGRLLDSIAAEVEPGLPLAVRVREAQLYVEDAEGRWHERRRFPLADAA